MKPIRCIAIDDEPPALQVIGKFCERMGGIELTVTTDPTEGLRLAARIKPDIVFLDIEMEGMSGLDVAAKISRDTCVIFTTAYLDYAIDGFNLDAVDYLHKPFAYSRFQTAVGKAKRRLSAKPAPAQESITVKQEYSSVSIPLDDIVYIEDMEGYSKIFRTSGRCTITRLTLKNVGAMLPPEIFVRVHRSFIIARTKAERFSRQEIIMNDGTIIPIGRQYAETAITILGIK